MTHLYRFFLVLLSLFFIVEKVPAKNSDSVKDIKLGMTTALSGPARELGVSMRLGIETYFRKINDEGGIGGRKLTLIALDDGYQPHNAAINMRRLIAQEVLAVIGNVGTPTAMVTKPIAEREKTLLFGAFTGAELLRETPPSRYVINFRASYKEETAAIVKHILAQGVRPNEIAFFTQNDSYGDDGYEGAIGALLAAGYENARKLAHGRYQRNTQNVEDGLLTIFDSEVTPRAIIIVGAYAASARFISLARVIMPDAKFFNVSFVGSQALMEQLSKRERESLVITQVVPHFNAELQGVMEYRAALKKYSPGSEPGFVSLEGYLTAKVLVEGIKAAGNNLSGEAVIDAIESFGELDIGIGVPVRLGPDEHQALHKLWMVEIIEDTFSSINLENEDV